MPSTKSDSSMVALPYRCAVCSPAMPAISGWSSGIAPHPIRVGITGTLSTSASSTSRSAASALMMPPPATSSGRSAAQQHVQGLVDLGSAGGRCVDRQRGVGVGVEVDLGHLHVERQVDQHWPGTAGPHQVEGLLERTGHLAGLEDGRGPLRHRLRNSRDVDDLEVLLVQPGDRRLAGDAQDRHRVGRRGVQAGDHVGRRPARRCRCTPRCCRPWPGCTRPPYVRRPRRAGPGHAGSHRVCASRRRTG